MTDERLRQPEVISEALATEIATAFDAFWAAEVPLNYHLENADEATKQRYLDGEMRFVEQVLETTLNLAASNNGPVTVLFDLDETIALNKDYDATPRHLVRPSFPVLAEELKRRLGSDVDIGILTGRGQSHLNEEMANPQVLTDILSAVNPDMVHSVREDGILASAIAEVTSSEASQYDTLDWQCVERYDVYTVRKALMLHKLTEMYPDRAFVCVDDHQWVTRLNPDNPRVRGVHATGETMFFV